MAMVLVGNVPVRGLPGRQGTNGTSGKSAYVGAVEAGYSGTEPQFYQDLASIRELIDGLEDLDAILKTI